MAISPRQLAMAAVRQSQAGKTLSEVQKRLVASEIAKEQGKKAPNPFTPLPKAKAAAQVATETYTAANAAVNETKKMNNKNAGGFQAFVQTNASPGLMQTNGPAIEEGFAPKVNFMKVGLVVGVLLIAVVGFFKFRK